MQDKALTVYIINPSSGAGHLDSYCRLYSRAFLEIGWKVILISPEDGFTHDYLKRLELKTNNFKHYGDVEVHELRLHSRTYFKKNNSFYSDLKHWRKTKGENYKNKSFLHHFFYILARIYIKITKLLIKLFSFIESKYYNYKKILIGPNSLLGKLFILENGWFYFKYFNKRILLIADHEKNTPDLMFIMYLDALNCSKVNLSALNSIKNVPWSGILFAPQGKLNGSNQAIEKYFHTPECRGAVFLVEKHISKYKQHAPHLHFQVVPDVADTELPTDFLNLEKVKIIRELANGRKIVSLIGSLKPHKGVVTFLELAMRSNNKKFFFIMIGKLNIEDFNDKDQEIIKNNLKNSNLYLLDEYVQDEKEYNALFCSSDYIFAVYNNFDSSSNTLTKAAAFCKPVLADAGSTVGNRVTEANIGIAVDRDNITTVVDGLVSLEQMPIEAFKFKSYNDEHSFRKLKISLQEGINNWISTV